MRQPSSNKPYPKGNFWRSHTPWQERVVSHFTIYRETEIKSVGAKVAFRKKETVRQGEEALTKKLECSGCRGERIESGIDRITAPY